MENQEFEARRPKSVIDEVIGLNRVVKEVVTEDSKETIQRFIYVNSVDEVQNQTSHYRIARPMPGKEEQIFSNHYGQSFEYLRTKMRGSKSLVATVEGDGSIYNQDPFFDHAGFRPVFHYMIDREGPLQFNQIKFYVMAWDEKIEDYVKLEVFKIITKVKMADHSILEFQLENDKEVRAGTAETYILKSLNAVDTSMFNPRGRTEEDVVNDYADSELDKFCQNFIFRFTKDFQRSIVPVLMDRKNGYEIVQVLVKKEVVSSVTKIRPLFEKLLRGEINIIKLLAETNQIVMEARSITELKEIEREMAKNWMELDQKFSPQSFALMEEEERLKMEALKAKIAAAKGGGPQTGSGGTAIQDIVKAEKPKPGPVASGATGVNERTVAAGSITAVANDAPPQQQAAPAPAPDSGQPLSKEEAEKKRIAELQARIAEIKKKQGL